MKIQLAIAAVILVFALPVYSQMLSNDTIQSRIKSARAEKNITLTHDAASNTSKLMAVSENFSRDEADRSGVMAMNFALGIIYPANTLVKSPDTFILTFWVMSKKPRFGANHSMTAAMRDEMLVIGSARYVAKPREQMEYLNFDVSRENLAKIAAGSEVQFQLGEERFTFTKTQMKLLADVLAVTEVP